MSTKLKQLHDDSYRWYVLSVVSGQENIVVENLKEKIKKMGLENDIVDFMVPMIPQKVERKGKTKIVLKKLYPGYVFVKSKMNDKIWYVLRNTPGVRLIVGAEVTPIPLTDQEYEEILRKVKEMQEKVKYDSVVKEGDLVRIKTGEYEGLKGMVKEIDHNRGLALVNLEILGRVTPVHVPLTKIELVED